MSQDKESKESQPAKRVGRPKKSDVVNRKRGATGLSRGRPKGDAAIINEYKTITKKFLFILRDTRGPWW